MISGDKPTERTEPVSPYRTGRELEAFFRDFMPAHSPIGGPSRLNFTRELLRHHREAGNLRGVLEDALDPMSYRNPDQPSHDVAVEFLQDYLERDGYQVTFDGGRCRVAPKGIVAQVATHVDDDDYARMIGDYLAESERLADGDHDGVITLARTMVEAALQRMEAKLDPDPPKWVRDTRAVQAGVADLEHRNRPDGHQRQPGGRASWPSPDRSRARAVQEQRERRPRDDPPRPRASRTASVERRAHHRRLHQHYVPVSAHEIALVTGVVTSHQK